MYEYRSREKKTAEGLLSALFLLLSAASIGASGVISVPLLSGILRLVAAGCFLAAAWIAATYLFRSYAYCIAQSDREDGTLDFTVTEHFGKRKRTVCRIAMGDVVEVLPRREATSKSKKQPNDAPEEEKRIFSYTGRMFSKEEYRIRIRDFDGEAEIRICADEKLLSLLNSQKSNICL